jgi:hypothetical protein
MLKNKACNFLEDEQHFYCDDCPFDGYEECRIFKDKEEAIKETEDLVRRATTLLKKLKENT